MLGLGLIVGRLAQEVHINQAAGPPWQGAKQMLYMCKIHVFTPFGSSFPANVQTKHLSTGTSITQELYIETMQQNEPPVLKHNSE